MLLRFTKMHGLGNDFVVLDAVTQDLRVTSEMARHLADRHLGIGCDQVLVVEPPGSPDLDFNYRIFNADGGEVAQCGNGARCFAKFVRDRQLTSKSQLRVQTASGVLELNVHDQLISVAMGVPGLQAKDVPFEPGDSKPSDQDSYLLDVNGTEQRISVVSMGNPHAVLLVDDVASAPVSTLGPEMGRHPQFPEGVNVGFMAIRSRREIDLRVYERGAGETLACGSGACAAVVAGRQQDLLDSEVTVNLTGGQLGISWPGENQTVVMTGPASSVFHGRIYYDQKKHDPKKF
ncbi:MAG: diaminopimelate epimerase [Porticoccaceae bacterium]